MAGKLIDEVQTAYSATSQGRITVTSSVGFYKGATCWIQRTDTKASAEVVITKIVDSTHVDARFVSPTLGGGPNYGNSNLSAYNSAGTLTQQPQLIYNSNDKPLD